MFHACFPSDGLFVGWEERDSWSKPANQVEDDIGRTIRFFWKKCNFFVDKGKAWLYIIAEKGKKQTLSTVLIT
jgi:hypothetical protein